MTSILERNKNLKQPEKKTYAEYAQDALYREVWEDVNNEKTTQFLKKYWKYIVGVAAAIMIVVCGIQFFKQRHLAAQMAMAQVYETAVENKDATALANLSKNSKGAMADLALFQSYLLDNDVKKLEDLSQNGATRDFRDLAKLHLASINGDKMTAAELETFLSEMDTKKSPFYYNARLMVAEKYLSEDNKESADKILDAIINDSDAPESVSAHAQILK